MLETKAEGRAVDGKLRELLTWGLPTPGGKKQTTRSSYLVTALLAEQGKVDSILHSSLEDDPLSSGRELVTSSLNAVGRDPLVEQLFERLTTDLETVFNMEKGTLRRSQGSALVRSGNALQQAEAELAEMAEERRNDAVATRDLQDAMRAADEAADAHDEAVLSYDDLKAQRAAHLAKDAARETVDVAQAVLDTASEKHREHGAALLKYEADKAERATREHERAQMKAKLESVAEDLETARATLRTFDVQRETDAAVAGTEREKRTLELQAQLDEAERRRAAAIEAQQAHQSALEIEREFTAAEEAAEASEACRATIEAPR